MADKRMIVSVSPHIRHGRTIQKMVMWTIVALLPAAAWGVVQFGVPALLLLIVGVAGAVGTEAIISKAARQPLAIGNLHAVLVGLMIGMLLPAGCPVWVAFIASVMGIMIGKMVFGPLGGSPISPVLVGILIVALSWPDFVASFTHPNVLPANAPAELKTGGDDLAPAEDPQTAVRIDPSDAADYRTVDLFVGKQAGMVGTISPLLLLLGGLFLLIVRVIRWQGPAGFLLGLTVATLLSTAINPGVNPGLGFQMFTGASMFGAFFLCTEWSSTPVSPKGLFLFGLFAGALMILFRLTGMEYGPTAYAVAIMSLATPLFDRIATVPFGKVVDHA